MDVKEIGNRIKQARVLRNFTLDDIANDIGVAKSTIQRYENGLISKPKLPILQTIADSLRVNPAWICGLDVPMISDDSLDGILKRRLDEIEMTIEEIAEKSAVPLHWLQNIDTFTPGELGDYEIGYDWITKVAEVIGLPGGELRAALAKQEIPLYEGNAITAEEAFKQAQEDFKEPFREDRIKFFISQTEQEHLCNYRSIDEKGKHTVDTVLKMEYERCKLSNIVPINKPKEEQIHRIPKASHERTDIEVTDEMRQHDDDIMNDPDF